MGIERLPVRGDLPTSKLIETVNKLIDGYSNILHMHQWDAEPPIKQDGTVAIADGTKWNPGSGQGLYQYQGDTWVPCFGSGGGGVAPDGTPFTNLPNKCSLYRDAAFSVGVAGDAIIPMDSVIVDPDGLFYNGGIRPNQPGYYWVAGEYVTGAISTRTDAFICLNTASNRKIWGTEAKPTNDSGSVNVTGMVYCNGTTDTIFLAMSTYGAVALWSAGNHQSPYLNQLHVFGPIDSTYVKLPSTSAYVSKARMFVGNPSVVKPGGFSRIPVNVVDFDPDGICDTANNRMIPKKAGYYHVDGMFYYYNSAQSALASIYKNGVEYIRGNHLPPTASGNYLGLTVSGIVYCNGTTDYIELWGYATGDGGSLYTVTTDRVLSRLDLIGPLDVSVIPQTQNVPVHYARAYVNTNWGWSGIGSFIVPTKGVSFDPYGIVDTTNGCIRPKSAGYYQVNVSASQSAATTRLIVSIAKNGPIEMARGNDHYEANPNAYAGVCSDLVYCNGTTDYLNLAIYSTMNNGRLDSPFPQMNYISVLGPFN